MSLLDSTRNCCFGEGDDGEVVKVQPPRAGAAGDQPPRQVPYLPGETTASGRDVFLVEGPVTIDVNGQVMTVDTTNLSASTSLLSYLRNTLKLTGTKAMCYQAGCGACMVTATFMDPFSNQIKTRAVNACITPLLKCDGWSITTVEGVGTPDNLDEVQSRLVSNNGTQCGFCTPGFVMSMHSLRTDNPSPTTAQIEEILDSNICRCTGYRPIFDAFRSFASENRSSDIEDLVKKSSKKCPKSGLACGGTCSSSNKDRSTMQFIRTVNGDWVKPTDLDDLMAVLMQLPQGTTYQLVCGNTMKGVYSLGAIDTYIDVTGVPELTEVGQPGNPFILGGNLPITDCIKELESKSSETGYEYCAQVAAHLKMVANTSVRNVGSLAGNLMLKHAHPEFASDVTVLLAGTGATIWVRDSANWVQYTPTEFLALDMDRKVINWIEFPQFAATVKFSSFKITPRKQNAHAYVNGAFKYDLDASFTVIGKPSIVFGGYGADLVHALLTEDYLVGRKLNEQGTLDAVVGQWLQLDLDASTPDLDPVLADVEYRTRLVKALFYKGVLSALGDSLSSELQSGGSQVFRGISSGMQTIPAPDDTSTYPIHEAVEKIEGKAQVSGADYADDIASPDGELYAAVVMAPYAPATFDPATDVDTTEALATPGVVAYFGANDIPGQNKVQPYPGPTFKEELLCSGTIGYAGQPIGVIVAESSGIARSAAAKVVINYTRRGVPVIDAKQPVLAKMVKERKETAGKGSSDVKAIEGTFSCGSQYHFHMETQIAVVTPVENGTELEVVVASQHLTQVQSAISVALAIPSNAVHARAKRLGGAYGGKINRANIGACLAALAAFKLNARVKLKLSLSDNMKIMGKRPEYSFSYSAALDSDNKLDGVAIDLVANVGYIDYTEGGTTSGLINGYTLYSSNNGITATGEEARGNTPKGTPVRAPAWVQAYGIIDTVMEHLAVTSGLDPVEFRSANIQSQHPLPEMITRLKQDAGYDERLVEITTFNLENKWKKRGLGFTPLCYQHDVIGGGLATYSVQVAIYEHDSTINITHGGIEMGQGINTKVAQVVAAGLGLPDLSLIKVRSANTFVGNNNIVTGGSQGSDYCCYAAEKACEELVAKMSEFVNSDDTWADKVRKAASNEVDLTARYSSKPIADGAPVYFVYGATLCEVEVDILTGEKNIRRVDLMEDVGNSVSPLIDLGQVEGGFVFGLGFWTSEEIKYDPDTGELLTYDTWEYKPPCSRDIPEDFRITFSDPLTEKPSGPMGSKCTGEPSTNMAVAVVNAIRSAIQAGQIEVGAADTTTWVPLTGPATVENIMMTAGVTEDKFTLG